MLRRSTKVQLIIFVVITLVGVSSVSAEYVGLGNAIDDGCTVSADLPDSGGIFTNAEVTYRGVTVGEVGSLHLIAGGTRVDLTLKSCSSPKIPAGASATVADRSVVGEQYVDLKPSAGTKNGHGPYLADGAVIPMSRNHLPVATQTLLVDLDRLFSSVPLDAMRTTISELGTAFDHRGDDLGRLIDATDKFIAVAGQIRNVQATIDLIERSSSVLQTQLDQRDSLTVWTHNLNLLAQQLKTSDPDFRHLLATGPFDITTVHEFINNNATDLGLTLANLTTVGNLLVRHLPGIEQVLELYPVLAASGPSTTHDRTVWSALVLQAKPDPQDCGDPFHGREGYTGSNIRTPFQTAPEPPNVTAHCAAPNTGRDGKQVRGSAHIPGGDPISLSGAGYAYPRAVTSDLLRIGTGLPTSDALGDSSWIALVTDALR
jgi:phospholipid/cholesterol/gamma-HCH transport system substrate-binding protein